MTIIQKFINLTPEQKEKLAAVKDAAALEALASECGIELTGKEKELALEYFQKGILPLDDDDLDAVAGGASKIVATAAVQAVADGRTLNIPAPNNICTCDHLNVWAKRTYVGTYYRFFDDVKCYRCGQKTAKYTDTNPI